MSRNPTSPPMLAKTTDVSGAQSRPRSPQSGLVPPDASPEDVFESLSKLLEEGHIGAARRLTAEAGRRFPDHDRIRLAKRVLNDGVATPDPYVQPTAAAESEWLDHPPEEARGKWVALIGGELVGMADTVDELMESLASKDLKLIPLVHHLAA